MRILLSLLIGLSSWTLSFAGSMGPTQDNNPFRNPVYIGAMGGFGSTTWQGLVPAEENQSIALSFSTPIEAQEGGAIWGFFAGYELSPYFAIEANYAHYPNATILFDENSLFAFDNNGQTQLITQTETVSLMAKLMIMIPHTSIRLFSGVGAARIQRTDEFSRDWRASPTFSAGLNHNLTSHLMAELGANYTAGYGESELNPAKDYVPFLYSVFLKLAYRF